MDKKHVHECIKQLQKAIECSICLDDLLDPVETRCGHTFCGKCLDTALCHKSVLPCPLCKYQIKKRGIKKSYPLSKVVISVKAIKKAYNSKFVQDSLNDELDCSPILSQRSVALSQQRNKPATLDLLDAIDDFECKNLFINLPEVGSCAVSNKVNYVNKETKNINPDVSTVEEPLQMNKRISESNIRNCKQKKSTCRLRKTASKLSEKSKNNSDKLSKLKKSKNISEIENVPKHNRSAADDIISISSRTTGKVEHSQQLDKKSSKISESVKQNARLTRSSKHRRSVDESHAIIPDQQISKIQSVDYTNDSDSLQAENDYSSAKVMRGKEQEKISSWLTNVAPVSPTLHSESEENHQDVVDELEESDFDDFVSASQQMPEHQIFNSVARRRRRRRRNMVSDEILNDIKAKSAKKVDEVFGVKPKQQQYRPKSGTKDTHFYGMARSPKQKNTNIRKTPKRSKQKTTAKRKKNMFDVVGLSQGVSPFSSPAKDDEIIHGNSQKNETVSQDKNVDSMETSISNDARLTSHENSGDSVIGWGEKTANSQANFEKTDCESNSQIVKNSNSEETTTDVDPGKQKEFRKSFKKPKKLNCENTKRDTTSGPQSQLADKKEKRNFGSPVTEQSSQDSKSTIFTDEPKVTTVTAVVHSQPKAKKTDQITEFKTPISKACPSKLSSTSRSKYGLLRLEDMPIVCVGETQDDSEQHQPYRVETPGQSEASNLPKITDCSPVKIKFSPIDLKSKKPVELDLLNFSEPSQDTQPQKASQKRLAVASAAAILQDSSGSATQMNALRDGENRATRRSCRLKNTTEASLSADPAERKDTATVSEHADRSKTSTTEPKVLKANKRKKSLFATAGPHQDTQPAVADIYDNASSNVFSLETNIIENTEEVAVSSNKPRLNLNRTASLPKEAEKVGKGTEIGITKESVYVVTADGDAEADEKTTKDSEIIPRTQPEGVAETQDDIFGSENQPNQIPSLMHISATWPEADQLQPHLTSIPSCGIVHVAEKELAVNMKKTMQKDLDQLFRDPNPARNVDESSVSSSPSLFAPSQTSRHEDSHTISGENRKIRQTEDKAIQVNEICSENRRANNTQKDVSKCVAVQCSSLPVSGSCEEDISFLLKRLKTVCEGFVKDKQIFIELQKMEDILLQTIQNSECSSESAIKTKAKKRLRALSSSESESSCSPAKDIEQAFYSDEPDIVDVEIESSLPELRHTRKKRCKTKAHTKKSSQKQIQSPKTSDLPNMKPSNSSPMTRCFSPKTKNKNLSQNISPRKTSQEVQATNNSDDTDVIQATFRSTSRRKRVISSDEENSQPSQPKKWSKTNKQTKTHHVTAYSNALFDTADVIEPPFVDLTKEQPKTPKSTKNKKKAHSRTSRTSRGYETRNEFEVVQTVNESPLSESQIPPPTPPPPFPAAGENSEVNNLLESISELTKASRHHQNDPISQERNCNYEQTEMSTHKSQKLARKDETEQKLLKTVLREDEMLKDTTNASGQVPRSPVALNINELAAETATSRKFGVMVSGLRGKAIGLVKLFAKKWGGEFYESFVAGEVTHAVVRTQNMRCDRTLKYLQAVAGKAWVVSISWVTHSLKEKTLLPEDRFEVIGDNLELTDALSHGPQRSRLCPTEFKLLSGFVVYCIPPFALFTEAQYVELLQMCGARVVRQSEKLSRCLPGEKKIITVDPDAYSDELPNYAVKSARICVTQDCWDTAELCAKYEAEAVACSWALDCIATFNLQPSTNFPVEDMDSEVL